MRMRSHICSISPLFFVLNIYVNVPYCNDDLTMTGNLETDPEYQLILDCNRLIHDIDDEIAENTQISVV